MARLKSAARVAIHATFLSFAIHAWHCIASDRMLDAAYDVGLDQAVKFGERAIGVEEAK